MLTPQSNNPYRASMLPPDESEEANLPPSRDGPVTAPANPATSPAAAEPPTASPSPPAAGTQTPPPVAPTPARRPPSIELVPLPKKAVTINSDGPDHVVVTIRSHTSSATELPRPSCQLDQAPCSMWPARKQQEKMALRKKNLWMWIKIVIALVIIVGAVALGLGITKAVRDAKDKR